ETTAFSRPAWSHHLRLATGRPNPGRAGRDSRGTAADGRLVSEPLARIAHRGEAKGVMKKAFQATVSVVAGPAGGGPRPRSALAGLGLPWCAGRRGQAGLVPRAGVVTPGPGGDSGDSKAGNRGRAGTSRTGCPGPPGRWATTTNSSPFCPVTGWLTAAVGGAYDRRTSLTTRPARVVHFGHRLAGAPPGRRPP